MHQTSDREKIKCLLKTLIRVIETKSYIKPQLIKFKEVIKTVHDTESKDLLHTCYNERSIDLVYLICRHNKGKLLRYLLYESNLLHYFVIENKDTELKYREDTLYYAICSNQFKIIEMLYDHWTDDLHWSGHKKDYNNFDVDKLKIINNLLRAALQRYENWTLSQATKTIDQTMMFNIHSLIALSQFQMCLYSKLQNLKKDLINLNNKSDDTIRLTETYAICNMIILIFNCYENQLKTLGSIEQNSVYENFNEFSEYEEVFRLPTNNSVMLAKTYLYVFYEVYFRKLDYNVCLLILDNLHSLKLRLTMPKDFYQDLENKLYRFIYHLSNKWNLYIPNKKNMKTKEFAGCHNNITCFFSINYNNDIFQRGLHIMYLERREFESALYIFKIQLQARNVKENIRKDKEKLSNQETNSLMLIPELRDIYSLKRMSQYIAQLYSKNIKYSIKHLCLLVERTLQVVGEFLKSTNETLHLQPTTEAIVQVEISVETVNDLKCLRDILCHVKDGELLKRIEISTNDQCFKDILNELKLMKKKIDEVIMTCRPLVEKALISFGLSLIQKRRKEMPNEVANDLFNATKRVRLMPPEKPYSELFWAPKGCADEYASEIIMLVEHSIQLESKLVSVTERIRKNFTRNFFSYKEKINTSLQKITKVKQNWLAIVNFLKDKRPDITISNFPNENDGNRIKSYSVQFDLTDNLRSLVQDNKLFAYAEIHCKFIKRLLGFIILKTETIQYTPTELDNITQKLESLNYNDDDMERIVKKHLDMIEKTFVAVTNITHQSSDFKAIKELRCKLTMTNFLTQEEKAHLISFLHDIKSQSNVKRMKKIEKMINKINNNEAIPKREYTNFITVINLDKKGEKSLMNLVMGFKRDPLLSWCLSKRIALLRDITKGQSVKQLVTHYKSDKIFRVLLEVLVFDVFAILECTKNNEIVKKKSKLLTEINLRNFLIHGNPLLEIAGDVLDSNDVPIEMIEKTIALLNEEKSINALCALIDSDFDFSQIDSNSLSVENHALVVELKTSARWKDYLAFIPNRR